MKQLSYIVLCLAALSFAGSARAEIFTFVVPLDGIQEVNAGGVPIGDPDGTGLAILKIDSVALTIDWNFTVSNIELPLTLAHIHVAPAGTTGPIRVDFNAQLSGTGLADPDLAAVLADPTNFYVNLHNTPFPAGAIRGQLAAPVPEPTSLLLAGAGIASLLGYRRLRKVA